jgi:hypothetical protein
MKKLLLLLFLIPNLVMGGMGQKQMSEPVEGNLFEILGDALNKDSKKNQSESWTPEIKAAQEKLKKEHQGKVYVKDSIPDMLPIAQKALLNKNTKWNPVPFGKTTPGGNPPNTRAVADFTKLERLNDGTFLIPWHFEMQNAPLLYVRVDCDTEEVEDLGVWKRNTFDPANRWLGNFSQQNNLNDKMLGYQILHFVCGFKIPQGPRMANVFLMAQDKDLNFATYDLNSIKKVDESNYILTLGEARLWNAKITNYEEWPMEEYFQFNCAEKSYVSSITNGSKVFINSANMSNDNLENIEYVVDILFDYPIENACEYIRLNPGAIPKAKEGDVPAKIKTKVPASKTTPKVSIDDAKKQCEDIGFKPKTEKFGGCVMELME